ncbi:MAG: hypothetical protein AW07_02859 [Candidatus Accumulibacter sp. SK-11]|nr:MAG: hypothetical protein AW07_02859 [Candidatus Accumulibacter sp. SK-11]HRL77552.1 PriCT-2 domain-containing protein [Candidatus Accumulibacter phosphatis]
MNPLSGLGKNRSAKPLSVSAAQQPPGILSTLPLPYWRGAVTTFDGWRRTRPIGHREDVTWEEVRALLAPEHPTIVPDKALGQSFLPCLLKEAPLVGSTLEHAQKAGQPTTGRMRSQHHVTEATMLVMDIDGLAKADFMAGLAKLKNDGIAYLAYTTFSHGKADKPGMRVRLVVPVDGALDTEGYRLAWRGLDKHYWNGQAGKADLSGARLCQQQGMWCCHRDRLGQARSWTHSGGVASAAALRKIGALSSEALRVPRNGAAAPSNCAKGFSRPASLPCGDAMLAQLGKIISLIDPDSQYDLWLLVLAVIFNETGGSEAGFALADEWSSAGEKYKGEREIRQKWHSFDLDHPNPARFGSLIWIVQNVERGVE